MRNLMKSLLLPFFLISLTENQEIGENFIEDKQKIINLNSLTNYSIPLDSLTKKGKDKDYVVFIDKSSRILSLSLENDNSFRLIKEYPIAMGSEGKREKENDCKTPEGEYYVLSKYSSENFYLFLWLNYPNYSDLKRGLEENIITQEDYNSLKKCLDKKGNYLPHTSLGGEIGIHGGGTGLKEDSLLYIYDWTLGCIALENEDVKEIYEIIEPWETRIIIQD